MKIGDYVHYTYRNYLVNGLGYGTGGNTNIKPAEANEIFKQHKNELLKVVKNNLKKKNNHLKREIEKRLNIFFGQQGTIDGHTFTDAEIKQMQEAIIKILERSVDKVAKANIDYESLMSLNSNSARIFNGSGQTFAGRDYNSSTIGNLRGNKIFGERSHKEGTKEYTTTQAIATRLEAIELIRANLAKNTMGKNQNITEQQLQAELDKLDKLLNDIPALSKYKQSTGYQRVYAKNMNKDELSMVQQINNILALTKQETNSNIQGILGEEIPKITQFVTEQAITGNLQNLLHQLETNLTSTGGYNRTTPDRMARTLKRSSFIGGQNQEFLNHSFEGNKLKINYTENKIDIDVNVGNLKIPASVKNYNIDSSHIGVLSGTSILKYTQDYPSFLNHYMNITASHPNPRDIDVAPQLLKQAHENLKMTIGLHALAGGTYGLKSNGTVDREKMAQVFIINEHGGGVTGKFKVYFMRDVIENILNNPNLINLEGVGQNPSWDNNWRGDAPNGKMAYSRIAGILNQMHQTKLRVSINKKALT